jgi:hypothetical protein
MGVRKLSLFFDDIKKPRAVEKNYNSSFMVFISFLWDDSIYRCNLKLFSIKNVRMKPYL